MSTDSPEQIVHTLVTRYGQTHKSLQFANYISAYQYLKLYELMARYVPQGSRVLDWGAGIGHFSHFLLRSGYQASGFGFEEWPFLCQDTTPPTYDYRQGSPANPIELPFADASFEAVVSVGVLEHVREVQGDELGSLREIRRILKPQGLFLCYHLPNRYSWIEFLARRTQRFSHTYRFTQTDIRRLTSAAALELWEMGRYAPLPRNLWQSPWLRHPRWGPRIAIAYNYLDWALSWPLSFVSQNYYFVAYKP